jgi:pimeloyl-ACP methyl ester carboxylesterase
MTSNRSSARRLAAVLGAAVLVPVVGLAGAPSDASEGHAGSGGGAGGAGHTRIAWEPCGADRPGYDCAMVTVPLDHDRPWGQTTELALARFPAADQRERIGTVFVNPGGPGGSGVEMVVSGFGEALAGQLGGRFDVVGFDPRGVGSSDPLHCFDSEEEVNEFLVSQPIFPYQPGQYRPFFRTWAGLGPECHDDRQQVVWHMNTADVARDLDLLRRAVGDRKLTYLGFSYGSYLGNTYANLFPENVRALAIDGVLNPRLWASGWQIVSDRVATREEFQEFLRLCDAAGDACAFHTAAGAATRWERLTRAIRRDPLELPDGFLYTYDVLIADATGAMYAPEVWGGPDGAAAFLDALADAALADAAPRAAARATRLRDALLEQLTPDVDEADYPNGWPDAYYGNQCADTEYPSAFKRWYRIGEYAEAASRFGPYWWWSNTGCAWWPVNDDRYVGPWTADTSAPVLVVGNYFDGVTDHAGAVATDRLLRNSRLLSYAGWGHTAYGRSACVTEHIDNYLRSVRLPPAGTVCPANPNPFLDVAARRMQEIPMVGLPSPWLVRR